MSSHASLAPSSSQLPRHRPPSLPQGQHFYSFDLTAYSKAPLEPAWLHTLCTPSLEAAVLSKTPVRRRACSCRFAACFHCFSAPYGERPHPGLTAASWRAHCCCCAPT